MLNLVHVCLLSILAALIDVFLPISLDHLAALTLHMFKKDGQGRHRMSTFQRWTLCHVDLTMLNCLLECTSASSSQG